MITFEITNYLGERERRVIVNGKVVDLRPGAVIMVPVPRARWMVAADKFERLMGQVPPIAWAMVLTFCALRIVWVVARP